MANPTQPYRIPFNRVSLEGREEEYVHQAMASRHLSGDGPFTRRASALLEEMLPGSRVFLTTSCTHALEMTALLLEVGPGDEVILPSFTFVSTANAFVLRGAKPVFADIRPDTLNLDEGRLEALVTPRTRAVVPVHYGGIACSMEEIGAIAERHDLTVIEDNAHGLDGAYRGRALGTFGALATQSFHETKNFSCGEAGALVVNDPDLVTRAEILREKGTDRSRFFRGEVDKYTWTDIGSSYLPSELLAAFLTAQLEARERIQGHRRRLWETYREGLSAWAGERGIALPVVPDGAEPAWHLFHLILPSLEERTRLIAHLKARGMLAVFHYLPLHLSRMGRRFGGEPGDCPVTEDLADRLVRLPFHNELTADEQAQVIEALLELP